MVIVSASLLDDGDQSTSVLPDCALETFWKTESRCFCQCAVAFSVCFFKNSTSENYKNNHLMKHFYEEKETECFNVYTDVI